MTILDHFALLRRWWYLPAASAAAAGLTVLTLTWFQPITWTATATLWIAPQAEIGWLLGRLSSQTMAREAGVSQAVSVSVLKDGLGDLRVAASLAGPDPDVAVTRVNQVVRVFVTERERAAAVEVERRDRLRASLQAEQRTLVSLLTDQAAVRGAERASLMAASAKEAAAWREARQREDRAYRESVQAWSQEVRGLAGRLPAGGEERRLDDALRLVIIGSPPPLPPAPLPPAVAPAPEAPILPQPPRDWQAASQEARLAALALAIGAVDQLPAVSLPVRILDYATDGVATRHRTRDRLLIAVGLALVAGYLVACLVEYCRRLRLALP